jgi:signal peptidase I
MNDAQRSREGDKGGPEDGVTAAPRPAGPQPGHDAGGRAPQSRGAQQASALDGQPAPGSAAAAAQADPPARAITGTRRRKRARPFWREAPVLIAAGLVAALVIKTFMVQTFYIPSSSMEDTLRINDMVLVNRLIYHFRPIARGDIVVFDGAGSWNPVRPVSSNPIVRFYDATLGSLLHSIGGPFGSAQGPPDLIKRVIGLPGDHVACCTAKGLVTVNGVALHEGSYLYPGDAPGSAPSAGGSFSITVPPGRLWVMGDHRSVSEDSRMRRDDPGGGTIPENKVIGRAFMIAWPPSRWRFLPIPSTFAQPGIDSPSAIAEFSAALAMAVLYRPAEAGLALAFPPTWLLRQLRPRGLGVRKVRRRRRWRN